MLGKEVPRHRFVFEKSCVSVEPDPTNLIVEFPVTIFQFPELGLRLPPELPVIVFPTIDPLVSRFMPPALFVTVIVLPVDVIVPTRTCGDAVAPIHNCPLVVIFPPRSVPSKLALSA